jgi:PmbA protein
MPADPNPTADRTLLERAAFALNQAKQEGAPEADVVVVTSTSLGVNVRFGALEEVERSESTDLGLRVLMDHRQAVASSTDLSDAALKELATRVVAMARQAPQDPHCGLVSTEQLARHLPALDLADDNEPTAEELIDLARRCEVSGTEVKGITNSEGGGAGYGRSRICLMTSHGFAGCYAGSSYSLSCSLVGGTNGGMERDYAHASQRHRADLPTPESIGKEAAERTLRRLNPRKIRSIKAPVVFDPRVGNSLLSHLANAISGTAVARGTSFLTRKMGALIFTPGLRVIDDPRRLKGFRSRPFDGEGVATAARDVISDGRLCSWLLDRASAHQLGLVTTGHASRGTGSPPAPAPSNLYLAAGSQTADGLIGEIEQGFYVTELIGMGVNPVTGDYSRGAAGLWIDKGVLSYPVSEVTIAGNLLDMYRALTPANDLVFRYGLDVPTLRIAEMTVAGS